MARNVASILNIANVYDGRYQKKIPGVVDHIDVPTKQLPKRSIMNQDFLLYE